LSGRVKLRRLRSGTDPEDPGGPSTPPPYSPTPSNRPRRGPRTRGAIRRCAACHRSRRRTPSPPRRARPGAAGEAWACGRATGRTTTRSPQPPAALRVGHPVLGPLGGGEARHAQRVASFTHGTTDRLRTSRSIRSSGFSLQSRFNSARSSTVRPSLSPRSTRSPVHPVAQRPRVDPQVPGHRSDRLARLTHDPDRFLTELRIVFPSCL